MSHGEENEKVFPISQSSTEGGLRAILRELKPNLRTHSYHFDGQQIFGVFQDAETKKHLLLMRPDAELQSLDIFINKKKIETEELKRFHINESWKMHTPDGVVDDLSNFIRRPIGLWLEISPEDSAEIQCVIARGTNSWHYTANRQPAGIWLSQIQMVQMQE